MLQSVNMNSSGEAKIKLREQFRSATRDALLAAAAEVFERKGAGNVRIEDVAAAAGVAVGTVYNYFADRAELVDAVMEARIRGLLADLDAVLSREGGSTPDEFPRTLKRFVEAISLHLDTNKALFTALIEVRQQHGIDAKGMQRREAKVGQMLARAETLMASGIRARVLAKDDPAIYAALLVGMIRGLTHSALSKRNERMSSHVDKVVTLFLKGAAR
jgi:AcrR family transcriptional regulator